MTQPKIPQQQLRLNTGANVGDLVELVDIGGGVAGLPAVSGEQLIDVGGNGLGVEGQVWDTLFASRSLGTIYTNETADPMMFVVVTNSNNGSSNTAEVRDANASPVGAWIRVDGFDLGTGAGVDTNTFQGVVPAGWQYRVRQISGSTFTLSSWNELKTPGGSPP